MYIAGQNLGHQFPGKEMLFEGLNFHLEGGELVGLVGPSGSGKSTLLSIFAGWERNTHGSLELSGITRTSWVFQNPFGVPQRSALDHVSLPLLARGMTRLEADSIAEATMERFALQDVLNQPFHSLSGGEAQRLMLARAIAGSPSLLLVDEPTAQLDPSSASTVNNVLHELARDNTIVVVATHDPYTKAACDRVIELVRSPLLQGKKK